ncbi:MAG TPA: helix-turn-helix transcriptional regulator [Blastocatellia bacterium]|nr:helix-turn-helix transcriptional regulator [Blastocatellia bacterium]
MAAIQFRQLLQQKRERARLSQGELARLAGLKVELVTAYEQGTSLPSFDACYRISEVISAKSGQRFVMQDLWQALKDDRTSGEVVNRDDRRRVSV